MVSVVGINAPETTEPGSTPAHGRHEREEVQDLTLDSRANRAVGAGRRERPEPADSLRTCFERDRDRILHSTAFRLLAGKTQVFVFPTDHLRTRLTHALEVAQVAVSISRALRLNDDLTEAIALGHDCGHGPGGHASETALSPYLADGFDHAVWGADVTLRDLNLCAETLDGIRNHSWSRPTAATLEGQVVSLADRIAYVCHDFEDAVHAGLITSGDLPVLVRDACGSSRSAQLDAFILGAVSHFGRTGRIGLPVEHEDALDEFRRFNFDRIYLRPASIHQANAVTRMLRDLVEHLVGDRAVPPGLCSAPSTLSDAVAYVAGMTDRFACELAVQELGYTPDRLPRAIDLRT